MIRALGNKVLLFPSPEITRSPGGIEYPEQYRVGPNSNNRYWVAAIGPKVVDLKVGDHVICPMPAEEHARLEGNARCLDAKHVIAKFEVEPLTETKTNE
jgi:co-chaperonin GroES (HSP10)